MRHSANQLISPGHRCSRLLRTANQVHLICDTHELRSPHPVDFADPESKIPLHEHYTKSFDNIITDGS